MNNELKAELIHCLNIGYSAQLMTVAHSGMTDYKSAKLAEIRAAIAKLENEPVDEINFEEQGK